MPQGPKGPGYRKTLPAFWPRCSPMLRRTLRFHPVCQVGAGSGELVGGGVGVLVGAGVGELVRTGDGELVGAGVGELDGAGACRSIRRVSQSRECRGTISST